MQTKASQRIRALTLPRRRGVMRQSDLEAKGIQGVTLARLVEDGSIMRIGRGLYELSNAEVSLAHKRLDGNRGTGPQAKKHAFAGPIPAFRCIGTYTRH
jgi:hypothetical protein